MMVSLLVTTKPAATILNIVKICSNPSTHTFANTKTRIKTDMYNSLTRNFPLFFLVSQRFANKKYNATKDNATMKNETDVLITLTMK